jgi:hypothetical protein
MTPPEWLEERAEAKSPVSSFPYREAPSAAAEGLDAGWAAATLVVTGKFHLVSLEPSNEVNAPSAFPAQLRPAASSSGWIVAYPDRTLLFAPWMAPGGPRIE